MLCGKTAGEFVGLCDLCCRAIKVKSDAFARQSRIRLEEAMAADEHARDLHVVHRLNKKLWDPI